MFDFSGIDDGVVGTSVGGLAETKPRRKERLPLAGVQPDGNKTRAVDKIRSLFDMRELDELKQRKQQENDGKSMKAKIDEEDPTFSTAKLTNVSSGLVGSRKEEESKRNGATKKPVSSLGFVGSSEGEKSKRDGATKKPALLKLYVEPCSEGALCECGCSRNRVERRVLYEIDSNARKTKRNRNQEGGDQKKRKKTSFFPNLTQESGRRCLR